MNVLSILVAILSTYFNNILVTNGEFRKLQVH